MFHFDKARLPRMETTPEGYLRGEAIVTRTGVFQYLNGDGTVRKELRHPDDILTQDSLDSLKMIPVTLDHPAGPVDANSSAKLSVGMTGETVRVDGRNVLVSMTITNADAIAAIKAGKQELSLGYSLDLSEEAGNWNGDAYSHRQRGVVYNHLAVVDTARAGRDARLNMDGASVLLEEEDKAMIKVNIDGLSYDAAPEVGLAMEKLRKANADAATAQADLQKRLDAAQGELDAQKEATKAAQDALEASKSEHDDAAIAKRVTARIALETSARRFVGDADLAALSDRQVREAALKAGNAAIVLDGRSDDYVTARFDAALELLGDAKAGDAQVAALAPGARADGSPRPGTRADADAAYAKSVANLNAWRSKAN